MRKDSLLCHYFLVNGAPKAAMLQPPTKQNAKNTDLVDTMISRFYVIYASA